MTKALLTLATAAIITLAACKKDKTTNNTSNIASANKGRLVCTADNASWMSDAPDKLYKVKVYDPSFSYVQDIYGTDAYTFGDTLYLSGVKVSGSDSTSMDFVIALTPDRVGTYTIGNYPPKKSGTAAACFFQKMGNIRLTEAYTQYSNSGTFEITSFSDSLKLCSGKFHFDMSPKTSGFSAHSVKDGVFLDAKLD